MKHAVILFFVTLTVYLLTAGGHLYSPDEEVLFRTTRSIVEERDLSIESITEGFATRKGTDDREYAQYGIGQPLLSIPFYLAGKWAAPIASNNTWKKLYGIGPNELEWRLRSHAFSADEIATRFACSFFNIFAGALLAAVLYLLIFELTSHRAASLFTASLYAFGSLAWPHSRPYFTETAAVLFIVFSWYAVFRSLRGRMNLWVGLAGASAGFAALIRMDSILMYPGLALVLLGPLRREMSVHQSRVHPFVVFCVPAALFGVVLLALNAHHFGNPFSTGYSDQPEGVQFSTPLLAGLYGFIFSVGKGMFFFSPPLLLGLFGWRAMSRRDGMMTAGIALSILVPLLVMSKWQNWAGGWCWGPRHIFMLHPFLAIPIAYWLSNSWSVVRRSVALALLVIGIGVQLLGSSQDFMSFHRMFFFQNLEPERAEYRWEDANYFRVLYGPMELDHWEQFYSLEFRNLAGTRKVRVPLRYAPAPIQDSLYLPQASVWAGYPRMLGQYRIVDNLWIRVLRSD